MGMISFQDRSPKEVAEEKAKANIEILETPPVKKKAKKKSKKKEA